MTQAEELSVAEVKRDFRRVLDAAERGASTLVLRRGRPVAVVAPVRGERPRLPLARRPGGLLSLLGALGNWETMEADMAEVVAARQRAADRPPPELD